MSYPIIDQTIVLTKETLGATELRHLNRFRLYDCATLSSYEIRSYSGSLIGHV